MGSKIKIGVMKKGDSVLSASQDFIAIKRKNGEVDIIRIYFDENKLPRLDMGNIVTIGYGDGSVSTVVDDDGSEIITF
jgi:hypothetical protein